MIAHHPPGKQAVQKVLGQHMGETPSLDMGRQGRLPGRKRWPFGDNQRVSREKEGPLCQCEHHRELTFRASSFYLRFSFIHSSFHELV